MNDYEVSLWAVRDPEGDYIHTTVTCSREDSILKHVEVEAFVLAVATGRVDLMEMAYDVSRDRALRAWPEFEAQGYTVGRVEIVSAEG
jgi:hypothetical protein